MDRSYDGGRKLLRNFGNYGFVSQQTLFSFNGAATTSNDTHSSLLKSEVLSLLLSVYSLQFHTCDAAAHAVIIEYISR
jgi:hypothetical protein